MPQIELQKHTLHLRAGDMDFIKDRVPEGKASELVRKLVSKFVDQTRAKETPIPEVPLSNLD